jgi:hypothetical protein
LPAFPGCRHGGARRRDDAAPGRLTTAAAVPEAPLCDSWHCPIRGRVLEAQSPSAAERGPVWCSRFDSGARH